MVGSRGPGEFVGEIGLLTGGVRTADVVAVTDASLLMLSQAAYSQFLSQLARVNRRVSRAATNRSVETVETLMAAERQASQAPVDLLLNLLLRCLLLGSRLLSNCVPHLVGQRLHRPGRGR